VALPHSTLRGNCITPYIHTRTAGGLLIVIKSIASDQWPREIDQMFIEAGFWPSRSDTSIEKRLEGGKVSILRQGLPYGRCVNIENGTLLKEKPTSLVADFNSGQALFFDFCPSYFTMNQRLEEGKLSTHLYLPEKQIDYDFSRNKTRIDGSELKNYEGKFHYSYPVGELYKQFSAAVDSSLNQRQKITVTCFFPEASSSGLNGSKYLVIPR